MIKEPVLIHGPAIREIASKAEENYDAPYKKETMGLLFGYYIHEKISIREAVHYGAHGRTRTQVSYNSSNLRRRKKELSKNLRMRCIGLYHSHVEIAGKARLKLSEDDKKDFFEDEDAMIDLLVTISAREIKKPRRLKASVALFDQEKSYYYLIRTYRKAGKQIRLILPYVINAGGFRVL